LATILIGNYNCGHFVYVATATECDPHDVNKITGREGHVTYIIIILSREVQYFHTELYDSER